MELKTKLEKKETELVTELPEKEGENLADSSKLFRENIEKIKLFFESIPPKYWIIGIVSSVIALLVTLYSYYYFVKDELFHVIFGDFLQGIDFDWYLMLLAVTLGVVAISNIFLLWQYIRHKKVYWNVFIIKNVFAVLIVLGVIVGAYVFRSPRILETYPEYDTNLASYDQPLYVKFAIPVRESKLKPSIVQDIPGIWEWEPYLGIEGLTRVGRFYPDQGSLPDQRYVVYIAGINKITDSTEHEFGYVFRAPNVPELLTSIPQDGATDVPNDQSIVLELNKSYENIIEWDISFDPELEFSFDTSNKQRLHIIPSKGLIQGEEYKLNINYTPIVADLKSLEIIQQEPEIAFASISFSVVDEPLIESFSPTGSKVRADSSIKLSFAEEMDMESVLENISMIPEIPGLWNVIDSKNLEFLNESSLAKNTNFKIVLKTGTKSLAGGIIEKELEYSFKTLGKIKVESIVPAENRTGVDENEKVIITFDQPVDKKSVEDRFTINPAKQGSFSWEGDSKLIFTPSSPWEFQRSYTVTLDPGMVAIHGLNSTDLFRSVFTIRQDTVVFSIPIYYQPPGFACNIFTAKMILSWKGVDIAYTDIIAEIGYNDTRVGNSWSGNPYKEYVGNADGSYGYGVYYPPIQSVFAARGISSTPYTGWNASGMANAISQGRPVIIWRYNGVGGGQDISWTAADGQAVNAFNGMHGSVITGFSGSVANPTSFYVNDPWLGQFWMDTQTLDYYWSFSGRMALEIY